MASSSSSLYRAVLGILSKTTGISLSLAASLAKRSANSLPRLPAWALILYEGVEDDIGEYRLRVNEMVVFSNLSVDMKFLCCVKICSFFMAMYYFHYLVHGAKQMRFLYQVFSKLEVLLLLLVFFVASGELSSCWSDILLWQSGQVNLYTPGSICRGCSLCK